MLNDWNLETGRSRSRGISPGDWLLPAVNPRDDRFVSAGGDHKIRLYNLNDPEPILTFEGLKTDARNIVVSPDMRYLLASSHEQDVVMWDFATGKEVRRFGEVRYGFHFSPTGKASWGSRRK